ncbi:MAG: HAD-IB family hydrolase [Gammaproteobacteria bacterium]|nr:HAD-IB family hydrolase [Gammaproteobacteria bacterium]
MKHAGTPVEPTLDEIKTSTPGPTVCAFFDLDGTIIAGFSAAHLSKQRLKNKEISLQEFLRTINTGINAAMGKADFEDLLQIGADAWAGRNHNELMAMGEILFNKKIINLIYPEMRKIIKAHQQQGHTVVLSSSATAYQVEPIARFLSIEHVLCNRFALQEGKLSGELCKPVIWGEGKAHAAQSFASERNVQLGDCFFYADGDEDEALMHLVGQPRPINPGKRLARVARSRGWPVHRFVSRKNNSALRSTAGVLSVFPFAAAGAGLALLKRDKRAILNYASPRWIERMFKINGVKLNVTGSDNLWAQRPAVFIFNHRNNYDAFMAARLIEKDFTGVGKKELENHWLTGTIGKLADVAFIDRADSKASVEALKPIEELARKGISICLAPEGNRVDTELVGDFKKGAFRMAMAAGIPVVPIVFRNAEMIAARDAAVMSPGTVDVTVLPPIAVTDWTLDNLSERIEGVRQLYIDTLNNWPQNGSAERKDRTESK